MDTLYPIFYEIRLVTFDVLRNTFEPHMHPEACRRVFNFILHQGGKFGIGGGYRAPGTQPGLPGFADEGRSFHQDQKFPTGTYYIALDFVVVNPGFKHRAPKWEEVPKQGTQPANDYGLHMNVDTEPWHGQPVPIDGWMSWYNAGRYDLDASYPIVINEPRPQPPQPSVPPPPYPPSKEILVQFTSRTLVEGAVGNDVKFFQKQMNDIAGQGLLLDGHYGPKTTQAVKNWQNFFKLGVDGKLGPATQRSIIEVSLTV